MSARIVHLLRHGPPARAGLLLGHLDEPPLVPQCPLIQARVEHLSVRRIVSSDLCRSAAAAAHLAQAMDVAASCDPRWRELDFGAWDGLHPDAVDQEALRRFWDDPDACPPPGGERWTDLCRRVRIALSRLTSETLVVTHAGTMRAAFAVLTGLDHRGVWAIDLPYRALATFRLWPGDSLSGQLVGLETGCSA